MTLVSSRPPRPAIISVIVGLGMLGSVFLIAISLLALFARNSLGEELAGGAASSPANIYVPGIIGCVSAVIFWGLSNMRRWAAYAYAGWVVLMQATSLGLGQWSLPGFLVSLVILACIFTQFKKMV